MVSNNESGHPAACNGGVVEAMTISDLFQEVQPVPTFVCGTTNLKGCHQARYVFCSTTQDEEMKNDFRDDDNDGFVVVDREKSLLDLAASVSFENSVNGRDDVPDDHHPTIDITTVPYNNIIDTLKRNESLQQVHSKYDAQLIDPTKSVSNYAAAIDHTPSFSVSDAAARSDASWKEKMKMFQDRLKRLSSFEKQSSFQPIDEESSKATTTEVEEVKVKHVRTLHKLPPQPKKKRRFLGFLLGRT